MKLGVHVALATAALGALAAGGVRAEPVNVAQMTLGYTYYNRIGATQAEHDAAVMSCVKEAAKVRSLDSETPMPGGGILGAVISGAITSAANRGVYAAAVENCMVVQGWRVVQVPDTEGQALAKLAPTELASRLEPWIGADTPHGQVVRVWGNDAANGATTRSAMRPAHQNDGLLSLAAVTASPLAKVALRDLPTPPKVKLDPKWPTHGLKPNQIANVTPEAGVVIVDLKGQGMKVGNGLILAREGPDKDSFPSAADHAPDQLYLMASVMAANKEANFHAVPVPPGRWRIAAIVGMGTLGFCLGAPSFEVKAGEVVYAGAFDLSAEDMGPDLSLDAPKAWLAGQPVAETIKPAVYTNGSLGPCGYNGIYALEIKGAPFKPGYYWGSAASATAVK